MKIVALIIFIAWSATMVLAGVSIAPKQEPCGGVRFLFTKNPEKGLYLLRNGLGHYYHPNFSAIVFELPDEISYFVMMEGTR